MKSKIYLLGLALTLATNLLAQFPEKISYQAVIRNSAGQLVTNQQVSLQVCILQGSATGATVYTQTFTPTTNVNGLISIEIGGGTGFENINWADGPYYIKTECDPVGGTDYTITGTSQILSVPYALHAKTAESYAGDEIFFEDNGQIASFDDNHRILFRRTENILEMREFGKIVFSPGATDGSETNRMILLEDGHVELDNKNIRNVADPVDAQDAATKAYVDARGGFSGDYNDLINKPGNATTTSDGFLSSTDKTKLNGIAAGAEVNVNTDWNAVSGDAIILNKPDLSIYATKNMGNQSITNLANPENAQDAATKAYVDGASGLTETDPTWNGALDTLGAIGRIGKVGIGTYTPAALLHINGTGTGGGNVLFTGEYKSSSPGDPPASGAGTRMMWYPDKAAFRAGHVYSVNWDKDSIGIHSVAMGNNTKAKGSSSIAMGYYSTASGYSSTAMGYYSTALGYSSTAMGNGTMASGYSSTTMGYGTIASGGHSTAMGKETVASGSYSTAIGVNATACGYYSMVMGYTSTALGNYSIAIGRHAKAQGNYSFAINLNASSGPEVGDNTFRISGATEIGGNVAWTNYSDSRLKKDIQKLSTETNLDKIIHLNGVRFRWKDDDSLLNLGFIAQEVKDIIPECVRYDELNDIYSMEYTALIPVLVEGIKEQQKMIEELKARIECLENQKP